MIIAIDFDGTCITQKYPGIGEDIGAERVLKRMVAAGHLLILWTTRSGEYLDEAVRWFQARGISLYGINNNPTQKNWTDSPKVYAHMYIDDGALGVPLCITQYHKPFVDWLAVEKILFPCCANVICRLDSDRNSVNQEG